MPVSRAIKTAVSIIACLVVVSCSTRPEGARSTSRENLDAQSSATAGSASGPDFDLVNYTGTTFRAVYLSPGDSRGWEENVLGTDVLDDGVTVNIRVVSNKAPNVWDLKVVARTGYYAEWKGLDLRGISRITLVVKLIDEPTAVAELE